MTWSRTGDMFFEAVYVYQRALRLSSVTKLGEKSLENLPKPVPYLSG